MTAHIEIISIITPSKGLSSC